MGDLNSTTKSAGKQLTNIRTVLDSTAESLTKASTALSSFNGTLSDALNSGNMDTVKDVLGNNTDSLAAALAGPRPSEAHGCVPCGEFRLAIGSVLHDSAVVRGIAAYGRNTQDHGVAQES